MRGLLTTLKKIFFWNYARNTWQWDVLCVLILIFIFLTPKNWLGERPKNRLHQSPIAKTVVLSPQVVPNEADKGQIEEQVRKLTGHSRVEVLGVRKVVGPDGGTVSFEVDIR